MGEWNITEQDWSVARRDGRRRSILVVDDDPGIRTMLAFLFEDEGFHVQEASDGQEALDAMEADPPDAMILDLMMPRVDGHGVLRARQERGLAKQCRIVVLTAKSDASDAAWSWRLGADEYVNKPVEPERILREVQALLRQTPDELRRRREEGLAEAERLDAMEAAFDSRRRRR